MSILKNRSKLWRVLLKIRCYAADRAHLVDELREIVDCRQMFAAKRLHLVFVSSGMREELLLTVFRDYRKLEQEDEVAAGRACSL
jgi:hypothetical protein